MKTTEFIKQDWVFDEGYLDILNEGMMGIHGAGGAIEHDWDFKQN